MKIKCKYCETTYSSNEDRCPGCGASNPNPSGRPRTIGELKEFCEDKGIPLAKIRFFIGENKKEPKCFGIYEDNGKFIVYKNKADGTRAVRYEGYDEAHAVNEIYEKLKEEADKRKEAAKSVSTGQSTTSRSTSQSTTSRPLSNSSYSYHHLEDKKEKDWSGVIVAVTVIASIVLMGALIFALIKAMSTDWDSSESRTITAPVTDHSNDKPHRGNKNAGYYYYLDDYYYFDGYDYWIWDEYDDEWEYYKDRGSFYLGDPYLMEYDDAYGLFWDDGYFDYIPYYNYDGYEYDYEPDYYYNYDYNYGYDYDYNYGYDYDDEYQYDEDEGNSWWSNWDDDDDDDDSWWSNWDDDNDDWDYDWDDDDWDYDWDDWDSDW